jgi:hypothetical protein
LLDIHKVIPRDLFSGIIFLYDGHLERP